VTKTGSRSLKRRRRGPGFSSRRAAEVLAGMEELSFKDLGSGTGREEGPEDKPKRLEKSNKKGGE